MSLLTDVKTALRVTNTAYDAEITTLIDAAKADLRLSGVSHASLAATTPDPLIQRAIITYCLGTFGMDNPDSEKYMASYRSLQTHLALSAEYRQPTLTGITGSITAATSLLTVSSTTGLDIDDWITIAGAGAGGALLIVRIDSIAGLVVTIDGIAGTTVTTAAVTLT